MATTKVSSRCAAVAFSMKKGGGDEITTKLFSWLSANNPKKLAERKWVECCLLRKVQIWEVLFWPNSIICSLFPGRERTTTVGYVKRRPLFLFPFPSLFLLLRLSETHFPPELTSSFCAESGRYKGNRKEGNSDFRGGRRSNGARKKAIFRQERRHHECI